MPSCCDKSLDNDRHGRINPDGSEMRGDSVENKQVPLSMSEDWFQ
jgi:hypothetical protein